MIRRLDSQPQHRTCWTLDFAIKTAIQGDIMVSNGEDYYAVQGFPIYANHSYFDPRKNGYTLLAGKVKAAAAGLGGKGKGKRGGGKIAGGKNAGEKWQTYIAITGKAMAMAGEVLFVAGEPMKFEDPGYKNYVAAYNGELGGRLLAISTTDGKQLSEFKLTAAPAWDGLALANHHLYLALADGTVQCLGE